MDLVEEARRAEGELPEAPGSPVPGGIQAGAELEIAARGAGAASAKEDRPPAGRGSPAEEGPPGDVARALTEEAVQAARAGLEEAAAGYGTAAGPGPGGLAGGRRGAAEAAALYRLVNAGRLRDGVQGAAWTAVRTQGERGRAGGMEPRDLDRAFQRDARRYDGGLGLL